MQVNNITNTSDPNYTEKVNPISTYLKLKPDIEKLSATIDERYYDQPDAYLEQFSEINEAVLLKKKAMEQKLIDESVDGTLPEKVERETISDEIY